MALTEMESNGSSVPMSETEMPPKDGRLIMICMVVRSAAWNFDRAGEIPRKQRLSMRLEELNGLTGILCRQNGSRIL